ncbi:hypothetical protein WR25_07964 [Diploscapter pachys]|uniref:Uncharacterized protein n=1 Tax=Diploscapter pachys TaxID=2018661 RepID=A0A2A2KJB1_9BILA|nr:hypothetical protein WR25_07964 [Diploscapter pachys]
MCGLNVCTYPRLSCCGNYSKILDRVNRVYYCGPQVPGVNGHLALLEHAHSAAPAQETELAILHRTAAAAMETGLKLRHAVCLELGVNGR